MAITHSKVEKRIASKLVDTILANSYAIAV